MIGFTIATACFLFIGLLLTGSPHILDPDHALILGVIVSIMLLVASPGLGAAMLAATVIVTVIHKM